MRRPLESSLLILLMSFWLFVLFRELSIYESNHEILVYMRAFSLYTQKIDPYVRQNMFDILSIKKSLNETLMVWNPPNLFIILSPLLSLPEYLLTKYWTLLVLLTCVAIITYLLYTNRQMTLRNFALCSCILLSSSHLYFELAIGQLGSLLAFIAVSGALLFLKGNFLISGLITSCLIVKPHIFALFVSTLLTLSILNKNYSFIRGLLAGTVATSAVSEIFHPGIWRQWLFREEWPYSTIGATPGSLLSHSSIQHLLELSPALLASVFTIGLFFFLLCKCISSPLQDNYYRTVIIGSALTLTPLASPYGFVFDYMVATFGIIFIALTIEPQRGLLILAFISMISFELVEYGYKVAMPKTTSYFLCQLLQPTLYALFTLWALHQKKKPLTTNLPS